MVYTKLIVTNFFLPQTKIQPGTGFCLKQKYNLRYGYPRFTEKETKAQHSKEDNETKWGYQPNKGETFRSLWSK